MFALVKHQIESFKKQKIWSAKMSTLIVYFPEERALLHASLVTFMRIHICKSFIIRNELIHLLLAVSESSVEYI